MPEIVKLVFTLKDGKEMEPGVSPASGHIDIDLGATTACAKVLSQSVAEDRRTVTLELEVPDGILPATSNMGSFYSVGEN
ncbi:MAG TPA: hypothetical protein VN039_12110 [Nitrospira sp.]|nr:hypothetical protein [Nitrospira sp.]